MIRGAAATRRGLGAESRLGSPGLVWGFYAPSADAVFSQWQREINAELSDAPAVRSRYIWLRMALFGAGSRLLLVSYITLAAAAPPLKSPAALHIFVRAATKPALFEAGTAVLNSSRCEYREAKHLQDPLQQPI